MRILVSNDDGYLAPGIRYLAAALKEIADVVVVAPDRDRSGASHSLNLRRPLYIAHHDNGFISVEAGTPTDCVHLAITGLFDREPDMVVSGINSGANLGDDVIYSGTVAAAMEGRHLGLPAMAISLVSDKPQHFATAARVAQILVARLGDKPLPQDTILNINVPDLPWEQIAGFEATRLGNRHRSEPVVKGLDPRGRPIFWIGPAGPEQDAGPGTDFHATRTAHVSVTPIQVDLTRYSAIEQIAHWLPTP
ncbi:MAG: 5'/3'-nucleotidase SurE [Gammaproteobacteria bacterium]